MAIIDVLNKITEQVENIKEDLSDKVQLTKTDLKTIQNNDDAKLILKNSIDEIIYQIQLLKAQDYIDEGPTIQELIDEYNDLVTYYNELKNDGGSK